MTRTCFIAYHARFVQSAGLPTMREVFGECLSLRKPSLPAIRSCRWETAADTGHRLVLLHREAAWLRDCRRSEEHTSELQSLMRISYAVFCLKKKKQTDK